MLFTLWNPLQRQDKNKKCIFAITIIYFIFLRLIKRNGPEGLDSLFFKSYFPNEDIIISVSYPKVRRHHIQNQCVWRATGPTLLKQNNVKGLIWYVNY